MADKKQMRKKTLAVTGAGFLVPFLLAVLGYVVIRVWPFGDGTVLIIDSIHQYLPFYTEFHEKLVTGQSLFYDFSAGMGYDFWATIAYYLASPLNLLMVFVPTPNVADFMDYLIAFKVACAGAAFCWYLHTRDRRRVLMPVAFGTMFAMGNFLIGYYFNLMWLDSIAVLPLVMAGIERLCRGKGGRLFCIALFYGVWCNYYIGFMLCLFSCLYFLVCIGAQRGLTLRKVLARGGLFAFYGIISAGCAGVVLLPAFLSLRASEAMQDNSFPSSVRFYTDFADLIAQHFAQVHPINISDNQVGLNAYCGTAVLILVILYALNSKADIREKIGKLSLTGLLLLSFAMNILNYVWHGFHTQNGLPNRFAFMYVALVLVMSYDALADIRSYEGWKIGAAGAIPILFSVIMILAGRVEADTYGSWVYLTPSLLLVYTGALFAARYLPLTRREAWGTLSVLLLAEAGAHGIYGYVYNENVTRSIYLADQASWKSLVGARGDADFFRSEIDSQRMRNVSMYAGANSIIMFNSTMSSSVTEFCDNIGMESRTNKNGYNGVTTLMNDLLGVRYVLSSNGEGDRLYGFEKIDADSNLSLYYNPDALPPAFMVSEEILDWDPAGLNPIEAQDALARLGAGAEQLYTFDRSIDLVDGETYDVRIPEGKQVYLYLPKRVKKIEIDSPEYSKTFTTYTDHLYPMNAMDGEDIAHFTVSIDAGGWSPVAYLYTCRDEDVHNIAVSLAEHSMKDASLSGNVLEGTVDAGDGGILLVTVPNDPDWRVLVDGEKSGTLTIGGALTGIRLPAGTHSIRMEYIPDGFFGGLVLSLLCAAALAAAVILEKRLIPEEAEETGEMKITFAKRMDSFQPGIFALLNERREELEKQGKTIYNLSVGTPDFPTPPAVTEAVSEASKDPKNYRYSLTDLPALTEAVQAYYERRFGVRLEADEIMSVYGSQEGMAHIAWVLCDPGDLVLVPNPGYPIFRIGPELCGAQVWEYPLTKENAYLPDFAAIPGEVLEKARYMVVNYPGNPLCRCAPDSFYEELIRFAKENHIVIVHDNAYSDIIYGGRTGRSFLSFEGAKEVGVEFCSLSKTFDYTGARMSFVVGNREIVQRFRALRSQFDYGIFYPVQYGAIAALREPDEAVLAQNQAYEERMKALCGSLREIGWPVEDGEGTMFVWAPLPEGWKDSAAFCMELMERSGVICTPGSSFGSLGEGYVRFALVLPPEKLREAAQAIRNSGILAGPEDASGRDETYADGESGT